MESRQFVPQTSGTVGLTAIVAFLLGSSCCDAQSVTAEATLPVHLEAAQEYRLYTDSSKDRELELVPQPLFAWTNPRRARGQVGHLFVWMDGEYPSAVVTIFSFPWQGDHAQQRLVHELHSLTETTLVAENRLAVQPWRPTGGLEFYTLGGPEEVSGSTARRRLRLRQLGRSFDASTVDQEQHRWPLRMMPKELLSYDGVDRAGALFAMLGDAGADPELLLLIETHRHGDAWRWRFAPVRMTDQEIFLRYGGREVWTSTHDQTNTRFHNANKTYFRFQDKLYDATEMLARESSSG